MQIVEGDVWEIGTDFVVITTNGVVRKDGACVMGRGVALQAKQRYPKIEFELGDLIKNNGSKVQFFGANLLAFPVKHDWWNKADIELIRKSCAELKEIAMNVSYTFALPVPGTGNGGLFFEEVLPVLEEVNLPDNVILVVKERNEKIRCR